MLPGESFSPCEMFILLALAMWVREQGGTRGKTRKSFRY